MHVIAPDGARLAVFRSGTGPPLLLVHGTTADHTTFRVVGPILAARRTAHAMDRRGRGASGDQPPYRIEREFEDVAAVVEAIAAEAGLTVDVLGHSFGGAVALGAAGLTPRIGSLILYESAPAVPGLAAPPVDIVRDLRRLEATGDDAGLLRSFLVRVVGLTPAEIARFEASPVYADRLAAASTVIRELTAGGHAPEPARLEAITSSVRIPVLQLLGGASGALFTAATAALDAALPDGRVVLLPGQKHAAHHDAADGFVAEVESFLDGRRTRRRTTIET
ncbi:MAG: alpha/beta hydrolase [Chloroflexi bacterium]|nr:alpha/beta hydrolase [Chloroflexota bacterium]